MSPATRTRTRRIQILRSLLGLLCIALVLLTGGVGLLHSHPVGATADLSADPACSLCALTHVAATPGTIVQAAVSTEAVVLDPPVTPAAAPSRFFAFSLYVRPPPVQTPLS